MKSNIKFPEAKKIDYTKFIEPKFQVFETTKNGAKISKLVTESEFNKIN